MTTKKKNNMGKSTDYAPAAMAAKFSVKLYKSDFTMYARSRRIFDACVSNNWPIEVAIGCFLYAAYEANPLDVEVVCDAIGEENKVAAKLLETITFTKKHRSFSGWIYDLKRSPYGRAVIWLRALDELAHMEDGSERWIEHLQDLRPINL